MKELIFEETMLQRQKNKRLEKSLDDSLPLCIISMNPQQAHAAVLAMHEFRGG